ncbi:M28 family metallopeptidase [Rossellomorea aquimaris]|uniref:M28 family metallopeptidase n=1 Tax=Rossellomorea aquimaris TaxID=189382 RepID=UPI0007D072B9|nr:M28 family metallopeptidase [Rossellomorea aquimaris]
MSSLQDQVMKHARFLSREIGCRPVGTVENLRAGNYIENVFKEAGLEVETQEFDVPHWELNEAYVTLDSERLDVKSNNFSAPCEVRGEVMAFCTIEELEAAQDLSGKIAFLYGELSKENFVPKGFTIYNPVHHQQIISLLEQKKPAAVITVRMQKESSLPIFNDWDFAIPSATVTPEVGLRIRNNHSSPLSLIIKSERTPGKTKNIIGRVNGTRPERIIICAHYDTVFETSGAFDNASGVSVMLLLAEEIMKQNSRRVGFEFISFSSEEYLGLGDEIFLRENKHDLQQALVAMNFDGVGQALGTNNLTLMSGSKELENQLKLLKKNFPSVQWTNPWYESNHFTFFAKGIPSIPFSCTGVADLLHTKDDQIHWLRSDKLVEVFSLAMDIIRDLQDKKVEWSREAKGVGI